MEEEALWIKQQRKAFTGWCNSHLAARSLSIESLDTDLETGVVFWNLLEIISAKKLNKLESANPKTKFQKVGNLTICFKFLEQEKLKLVNIGPEDVFTGNRKLILGLIWTLILRYQIQTGLQNTDASGAKAELLKWVNSCINPQNVHVNDFKGSFKDGKAFCALVNYLKPNSVTPSGNAVSDCGNAYDSAQSQFQIPKLLDPELVTTEPDELSIMTYVSFFKTKEPERPAEPEPEPEPAPVVVEEPPKKEPTVSASNSTAFGPGLQSSVQGVPTHFYVLFKDEDGNPIQAQPEVSITTPNGPIPAQISTVNSSEVPSPPEALPAEVIAVEYSAPNNATKGDISITHNGNAIQGSPYSVTFDAPFHFHLTKKESNNVRVPQEIEFILEVTPSPLLKQAKHAPNWADSIQAELHQSTDPVVSIPASSWEPVSEGKYRARITTKDGGEHKIHVKENGKDVNGSPVVVSVKPALSASNSTLEVEGKSADGKYYTEHPVTFTITVKDAAGNPVTTPEGELSLTVDGKPVALSGSKGQFTPQHAGTYKVEATLNGETIGNAVTMEVQQQLDAKHSSLEGPNLKEATKNQPSVFFVVLKDDKGHPISSPVDGNRVEVSITSGGKAVPVKVTAEESHKLRVDYTADTEGSYQIVAKVDGHPVSQSPVTLTVYPEALESLKITGHEAKEGMVDQEAAFWVESSIPSLDWSPLAVSVTHDKQGPLTLNPKPSGNTAQVSFRPPKAGKYQVHVTYAGSPVQGSPFEITVRANPTFDKTGIEVKQDSVPASVEALQKLYDGRNPPVYVAGSFMSVLVTLKDKDGDVIPVADLPVACKKLKVMVAGPFASQKDATASTLAPEKKAILPAAPMDAETFKAAVATTQAGYYRVALVDPANEGVTHKGIFFVIAAPIDASQCTVEGSGLNTFTPENANDSRSINVQLNASLDGIEADKVAQVTAAVELLAEDKETISNSIPVTVSLNSNMEATYSLSESTMEEVNAHHQQTLDAGCIRMAVRVHVLGNEIPGSPFYVSFDLPPIEEPEDEPEPEREPTPEPEPVPEEPEVVEPVVEEKVQEPPAVEEPPKVEEPKPKPAAKGAATPSPSKIKPPSVVKKATTPVKKTATTPVAKSKVAQTPSPKPKTTPVKTTPTNTKPKVDSNRKGTPKKEAASPAPAPTPVNKPTTIAQLFKVEVSDDIDKLLLEALNRFEGDSRIFTFGSITKAGAGKFFFGSLKVHIRNVNGNLVARVGGGWMKLDEFIQKHAGKISFSDDVASVSNKVSKDSEWSSLSLQVKKQQM